MIELQGKYNTAKVFTDNVENAAVSQIINLLNQEFTLTQFEKSMEGIYSSTVNKSTINESPFAYKPMEEIIANIGDTVEIIKTIRPLYNFKAAE